MAGAALVRGGAGNTALFVGIEGRLLGAVWGTGAVLRLTAGLGSPQSLVLAQVQFLLSGFYARVFSNKEGKCFARLTAAC